MKSLDTFRFTSSDQAAIEAIAEQYGGTAKPWHDKRASPQNQWEVITETSEIKVFLPQNSIDVWYEEWSGGGLVRRCDGIHAQVEIQTPDGTDIDMVPCHCSQQVEMNRSMSCEPHTRLSVILPDIRFGGTWRLESKGWNASKELPAMGQVITQMQSMGIVEGRLSLEKRTKRSGGQTRHFIVPRLTTDTSPIQILQGEGAPQIEESVDVVDTPPALPPSEEIVEAEVLEEGWDVPPPGVAIRKNPDPPPKWLPA